MSGKRQGFDTGYRVLQLGRRVCRLGQDWKIDMATHEKPTFILGVGAPKTGTTWLHEYLCQFPSVDMDFRKEYHVWGAKYNVGGLFDRFRVKEADVWDNFSNLARYLMQNEPCWYENYFSTLVKGNVTMTGDITPAYSALRQEHFRQIRDRLEAAGFRLKIVFLVRDPVQRCWSAVRMRVRNAKRTSGKEFSTQKINDLFSKSYKTEKYVVRTRYEETLTTLEKVFEIDDIYVGLYEEMFSDAQIKRISEFLGLEARLEYKKTHVNTSAPVELDKNFAKECFAFYRSTYDSFAARFPETRQLWSSY